MRRILFGVGWGMIVGNLIARIQHCGFHTLEAIVVGALILLLIAEFLKD